MTEIEREIVKLLRARADAVVFRQPARGARPFDTPALLPTSAHHRQKGRMAWLVAAASIVVVGLTVGRFLVTDRDTRSTIETGVSSPDASEPRDTTAQIPPAGCHRASELPQPGTSGLQGLPLLSTLLAGVHGGYRLEPPTVVPIDELGYETAWYAVAARVYDAAGQLLGPAIWLSPDPMAVFASDNYDSDDDLATWKANPAAQPEATYLFAANKLAEEASIWHAPPAPLSPLGIQVAIDCLTILPG